MRTNNTRGMGIAFVSVMVVLVFLALIGLGVKYFTRGATRVGETIMASEQAVQIGRGAIDEIWAAFLSQVNDPNNHLFNKTREYCTADCNRWTLSWPPKFTRALHSYDSNITIDDVEVITSRDFRIWNRNELEKFGLIGLKVAVHIYIPSLGRSITRKVVQWRDYKVLYPSPPRPFQGMTLFVLLPVYLPLYEKQYRQLQLEVEKALDDEEDRLEDKYKRDVDIPRPFDGNSDVYQYFPDLKYPPFPYNKRAPKPASYDLRVPLELTDMDNPVVSFEPTLPGDVFKLRWPVPDQGANDPVAQQLASQLASAQASAGTSLADADPSTIAQLQQSLDNLKESDEKKRFENGIRETLKWYFKRFGYLNEDCLIDFGEKYLHPLLSVDTEGKITVDGAIEYYIRNRCTHVFPDEEALYNEIGPKGGEVYLDGIYYVAKPFEVDFTYRGMGCIVGPERITVNQCRKALGKDDCWSICTLMSFSHHEGPPGSKWKSIELNCDVEAGIVCVTGMVRNLHMHNVFGSLAVGTLNPEVIDGDGDGNPYLWELRYDPSLWYIHNTTGAVRTNRSKLFLSPTLVAARVER